ncbi:CCAAT/enhancer-binding protein gamma [Drosophila navojoa]|nr:CCAAT/enhancer-binding protein gamma [Drosophila navojoa]
MTERMPARRSTAKASTSTGNATANEQMQDPAYKLKRKKNNEAVQRTREKTKKTAEERKGRINALKKENIELVTKIEAEKEKINILRNVIMQGKNKEEQHQLINEILNSPEEDNDDDLATSPNRND